uniref:NADH-ubiquinone oxidoreductase chain 4L n=1 Tax=Questa ersei TaxID=645998 RepID=C4NTU7_9ANNE|nr:NADH dehydrogenase subunit 4L [Questa ersei]
MNLTPTDFIPILATIVLINLSAHRRHLLMILLFLESTTLTLALILFMLSKSMFMILVLLTFAACEAAMGLSCVVKMTNSFGSDLIKSLSTPRC